MIMRQSLTIAILTYNRAKMLQRAVRSALAQYSPFVDIEVLVIDDGSRDNSQQRLAKYIDKMRYIRLEENVGVGRASALAVKEAKSEFFVRLDSDDFLSSHFALHMAPILAENPSIDFVSCDIQMLDEIENPLSRVSREKWEDLCDFGAGVIFRKSAVESAGGYDPKLRTREDLDLFLRLSKQGASRFHLPLALYRRRIHEKNISKDSSFISEKERLLGER